MIGHVVAAIAGATIGKMVQQMRAARTRLEHVVLVAGRDALTGDRDRGGYVERTQIDRRARHDRRYAVVSAGIASIRR